MLSLSHTRPSLQEGVDSEGAARSSEGEEAHRRPGSAGKRKKKARRSAASAPKASGAGAELPGSQRGSGGSAGAKTRAEAGRGNAQVMRAAMQQSLADAELSHKKAKEEELREGRLPGVQRRYSESPIFQQLCRVACPHLL
ncbi:hypothetical protein HaLaN_00192, partial [Haematococcus lacustris]